MRRLLLLAGCVGALVVPAGAEAAGGPVPAMQGGAGVSVPARDVNYVAIGVGRRTVVAQVLRPSGRIGRTRTLRGAYGVPGVAFDNATTGLSADGRTLVVAEVLARFPVRRTRLAVLEARRLRVVRRGALRGFHTVDAISPDGRSAYLIHYLRQDRTRYRLRAYSLARGRLVHRPRAGAARPRAGRRPARAGRKDAGRPTVARDARRRALLVYGLAMPGGGAVRARARYRRRHRGLHRPAVPRGQRSVRGAPDAPR